MPAASVFQLPHSLREAYEKIMSTLLFSKDELGGVEGEAITTD
jgi:hypothetical protein